MSMTSYFTHDSRQTHNTAIRQSLGWASIGVALTELLAPKKIEKTLGISNGPATTGVLRVLGVRELMHGIDLLAHDDPAPGVWSRVAGDMLDGVMLGIAATKTRNKTGFLSICAMVLPLVVADMVIGARLSTRDD